MRSFVIVGLLLAAFLAGCGGDGSEPSGAPPESAGNSSEGLAHIHGLGVSDDKLYIATHYGLWIAPRGQLKARRFSNSRQDIMGFSLVSENRFIGSGHPDPADSGQPPNLGLIESRDGGRTWKNVSLLGEADFHVLEAAGNQVYGVNSADGRLMASADGARSWQARTPPAGVFGLAIDERDPRRVVASTEKGVFASPNAGRGWRPLRDDVGGLLAWPRPDALYLLGADGAVQVSRDGGREWNPTGNIGGQPAAFIAHRDELYAALHDGTVKVSTDGGKTWTLRAIP
ncbi:MAG: F510_1955 family glycosylhydrolase [Solirubrobacteraceae bacterium]